VLSGHSWTAELPQPGSNRGYRPEQFIEQMIFSIWCGAARFAHADITRLDSSLVRLFDWGRAAGHKAVVGLFQHFDQASGIRDLASTYRWLFDKVQLNPITAQRQIEQELRKYELALVQGGFWRKSANNPRSDFRRSNRDQTQTPNSTSNSAWVRSAVRDRKSTTLPCNKSLKFLQLTRHQNRCNLCC
jgi:hypothetical protein